MKSCSRLGMIQANQGKLYEITRWDNSEWDYFDSLKVRPIRSWKHTNSWEGPNSDIDFFSKFHDILPSRHAHLFIKMPSVLSLDGSRKAAESCALLCQKREIVTIFSWILMIVWPNTKQASARAHNFREHLHNCMALSVKVDPHFQKSTSR